MAIVILGLASTEVFAWLWMNPKEEEAHPKLLQWNINHLSQIPTRQDTNEKVDEITWHPELVDRYKKGLNCSSGTVCHLKRQDGSTIYAALFAWDNSSSVTAIEAFRHRPDECLGSIGMTLSSEYPSRSFSVGSDTLYFTHTGFRDHNAQLIHAFKATWAIGKNQKYIFGLGQSKDWHKQRISAAWNRYKPSHACVVQGAVRSVNDPDEAWKIFENSVLRSLTIE